MRNPIKTFINKKIIGPQLEKLRQEVQEKNTLIMSQQNIIEKSESPAFFSAGSSMFGAEKDKPMRMGVDYKTLRAFSVNYDVARMCINRRKRQIEGVNWYISPKESDKDRDDFEKDIMKVEEFFKSPMGKYSRFRDLTNKLVDDLLSIDAAVVWKDKESDGLRKLITVDGATIKLRVEEDGSTPESPEIAFEQWIAGEKVAEFDTDEMIYVMLNPRTTTPYGLAPLESLILGVDAALKSQLYNLDILTEGNIPEGFYSLPESYTPKQVKEFQQWFDGLIVGNPKFQQRLKFMPGGKGTGYQRAVKPEDMKFVEYEKWLLDKTCALFDVMPSDIGFTDDINRATANAQSEMGVKVGEIPLRNALKDVFDIIIEEDLDMGHLEFNWKIDRVKDELKDAQTAQILIEAGAISIDEWREEQDKDPLGIDHFIMTGTGPVFIKDLLARKDEEKKEINTEVAEEEVDVVEEESQEEEEKKESAGNVVDLVKWEKKALSDFKSDRAFRKFSSDKISDSELGLIETKLELATDKESIKRIFRKHINEARQTEIVKRAWRLKEEIEKTVQEYEE